MALTTLDDRLEFLPLYPTEDEATILDRGIAWANEGLDPTSDRWVDTREGGHWRTAVTPCHREFARIYDLIGTEVVAAGIIWWSWGTYLDDWAETFGLERLPATPSEGEVTFSTPVDPATPAEDITLGTQVSVDPVDEGADAPLFQVTTAGTIPIGGGDITLPVEAVIAGAAGNVAAGAITLPSTPLPGVDFTNAQPTVGGTDPETDDALRVRILESFVGEGGGTILDYKRWAKTRPGVGRVTVIPIWEGAGTVLVIVLTPAGGPVSSGVITDVQDFLDPVAGQGKGQAPINHVVTVKTGAVMNVDVAATIVYEENYSADASGGTVALRQTITNAVAAYLESVEPGGEIVRAQIEGRIAVITGVHDVTVTTPAANEPVASGPVPQVPTLGTLTLS